jgi:hypothetical protein
MGNEGREGISAPLVTSREPVAPKSPGDKGTIGDTALKDGVMMIAGAWLLLIFLMFSLRSFNI